MTIPDLTSDSGSGRSPALSIDHGRRRPASLAAALALALLLALLGPAGTARADVFLDEEDPCPVAAPEADFDDRGQVRDVHQLTVDCAAALEITLGRPDGDRLEFMPAEDTRRDWMASFIVRTLEAAGYDLPSPSDQGFDDISGNTHEENINILAEIGVTKGKTAQRYAPAAPVKRDQMVSFLVRAAVWAYEGTDGPGFEAQMPFPFDDVDTANVHYDNIHVASEVLGLTNGRTETQFVPDAGARRDEMATFLIRLLDMIYNR